jgi:hypothetical protein
MLDKLLTKDFRKRPGLDEILSTSPMKEKMQMYGYEHISSEDLKIKKGAPAKTPQASAPSQKPVATPQVGSKPPVPSIP